MMDDNEFWIKVTKITQELQKEKAWNPLTDAIRKSEDQRVLEDIEKVLNHGMG